MSASATEGWLADLQARFSAALRAPLHSRDGVFVADPSAYGARLREDLAPSAKHSAAERLAVYQRQYWMRLFRVSQEQYPLLVRLLGAWAFNHHALGFLLTQPPRGRDLGSVFHGFEAYLEASLPPHLESGDAPSLPRAALLEAARLDAAFARVFQAPEQPRFVMPSGDGVHSLLSRRLRRSAAVACVEQHWPLLQLRSQLFGEPASHAVPLPAALHEPQTYAVFRTPDGVAHALLDGHCARLLALLEDLTLQDALAALEAECDASERAALPARIERFFARAVHAGFFSGCT